MPGTSTFDFGAYLFGISPGVGVNKEDLLDQITNVSPWDTPWCSQAPKVPCQHVYHQWLTDTLFSSLSDAAIDLTGAVEGADWNIDTETAPSRVFNVTMILRRDIGVSETQRAIAAAGFKDVYAYEIQKAVKRLSIKLERIVFGALSTATGATGSARVMKGFQAFIATNTAYVSGGADATHDAVLGSQDFNDMLNTIYSAGGNPEQVYVSPKIKRQVSAFTLPQQNRNIASVDKRLVSGIDFYDSDFGLIQIVLDRWVPESTNTTTATASATATGGKMFFLQRSINRLAWLRPMQHNLIGRRGDSVAGVVVGEVTLEVLNEKANGMLLGVNNKSSIT
jgi:uncharacterized protein DUF5309